MSERSKSISEYIKGFPAAHQKRLREMLKCLRDAAPNADESIKWGNPALSYETILFVFAAHKNHISLYPTPPVIKAFSAELKSFKTSSSTIQFPIDKPLPAILVTEIANYRVRNVLENNAKWM
jgi:uncharacterized protein YdhG (YjbR/CyaY superfamily)